MSLSRNINTYDDIQETLDSFAGSTGGTVHCVSYSAAIRWRQRAYMYRELLRQQAWEQNGRVDGWNPTTPYDNYRFTVPRGAAGAVHIAVGQSAVLDVTVDAPQTRAAEGGQEVLIP